MSHNRKHIISSSMVPALESAEVRECWTSEQCTKVDQIKNLTDWSDEQFRYIQRRLAQAFCADD